MKAGTIIQLSDGRQATVVYNGLEGIGVKWGVHLLTKDDLAAIMGGSGCAEVGVEDRVSDEFAWFPDALLREPYKSAKMECVGRDFEVIEP